MHSQSPDGVRHSWPWGRRLHAYFRLARISNSPTVVSDVVAGAALAGALHPSRALVLVAVALVLFYTGGMYLNDLCDYVIDSRERAERVLPSGIVSTKAAAIVVVFLFTAGALLLAAIGSRPFWAGLGLVGLIVAYDLWHKTNPLSPLLMAACRAMVYVIAFLAFESKPTFYLVVAALVFICYIVGLTYIAKSESRPNVTKYWPVVLLFLPAIIFVSRSPDGAVIAIAVLLVLWTSYSITFIYGRQHRSFGGAVARLIAGISLLDALVIGSTRNLAGVPLALGAFGLTLALQRYIKGT